MKKQVLKLITIVVLVITFASVFAGCGSTGGSATATSGTSGTTTVAVQSTQQSSAEALKEVTLRFIFGGDKKAATDEVWNTISEKYKDKLNAKFDTTFVPWGDYQNKLIVMSASGDKWDMNFDGDWLAYYIMSNKGAYLPLNDLLPKYAPALDAKYRQSPGILAAATISGNIVALPWTMKQNQRPYFCWRSDLAQKAGLNIPKDSVKTLDDIDKVLHDFKKAYPTMKIFQGGFGWYAQAKYELYGLGNDLYIDINDPACKIIPWEQTQAFKDTTIYTKKFYDDGIIPKDQMISKADTGQEWNQGKVATMGTTHEGVNANSVYADKSMTVESSLVYPDKKYFNRTPLANVVCINKNAANPERTLMFLDLVETDKAVYDLIQYGIEGKTYVLDGQAANYPSGMDASTSNYMDWGGQWAFWKPQFMRPTPTWPDGFWVKEAEFASISTNIDSPLNGLFFDTESVKNEIAKRNQIAAEYRKPLDYGIVKDANESIADYIDRQKAAGVDKIIAVMQKQIDDFLAKKK